MAIDPRHFRVFLAACRAGSLTGAARELSMAQPSVSVALAQLEHAVGARLFERSRAGITLNAAGEALRRRAEAMEVLLDDAARAVALAGKKLRGPLAIGGTPGALATLVPPVVERLRARGFGFELSVIERADQQLIELLRNGRIEFAVVTAGIEVVPDDIVETPIATDAFALIVGAANADLPDRVALPALRNAQWVLPQAVGAFRRQVDAVFIASGATPPRDVIRCDSLLTTKSIVRTTRYVTILPLEVVAPELHAGTLRAVAIEGVDLNRSVGVRRLRGRVLSAMAHDFLAACGVDDA
jgi:LysR family hydrogen peroxide-inducible transcriptional activator